MAEYLSTPMDTRTVYGRPGMATAVENDTEWAVVAHVRGHCHDGTKCPLCTAWTRQAEQMVRTQATITSLQRRAIDAEILVAYTAREAMEWQTRAEQAEHTLATIISGG